MKSHALKRLQYGEKGAKLLFLISATVSIVAVVFICLFLFAGGIPAIFRIGVGEFLGGISWRPLRELFGILPMIVGSIYVTAGAIIIGVPTGLLCAVFMARFCSQKLYRILKPIVNLLAGIPSVVYGFFGLTV